MNKHIFKNTPEMKVVQLLEKAGHEAYFVGGCVRDYFISKENENFKFEDIDVTTSASPEEAMDALKNEFNSFDLVGARFGVLMVAGIEIAQFRSETYEEGSKGKPSVQPAGSAFEDAARRDFTMNSIYMDSKGNVIDLNDGLEDIENKVVRAIGDPGERFNEDPSRILRLFYLAARFGFSIDSKTLESAIDNRELIKEIPDALVGKITKKVISYNSLSSYLVMLKESGIFEVVYPEFAHTLNKSQNPKYHDSDVFDHTVRVIKAAEENFPSNELMAMKAWCHDIAKGLDSVRAINEQGAVCDLGHEEVGAPLAKEFCLRLQFGKAFAQEVEFAVKWHGVRFYEGFKLRSHLKIGRKLARDCSSKAQMEERAKQLIEFIYLDAEGFNDNLKSEVTKGVNACKDKFIEVIKNEPFFISELPISGGVVSSMWSDPKFKIHTKKALEELVIIRPKTEDEALRFAESVVRRIEKAIATQNEK